MMKKLSFLFLIHCCFLGFTQEKTHDYNKRFNFAFSPGIIVQRNVFVEANLFAGKVMTETSGKAPNVGVTGFRVGIETDCNKTFAPKIGYEIAVLAFAIRLSAANYFQNGNSEFRLLPEIGISFGGLVNLTYGSGISLNDGNLTDIGHHRVALSFNLNRRLKKAALQLK